MKGPSKISGVLKRLAAVIPVTSYYGVRFFVFWTRRSAHIPENRASTKYKTRHNNDCHKANYA